MKKLGIGSSCGLFVLAAILGVTTQDANAIGVFKDGFFERFVPDNPANADEQALADAANAKTGKCYICHVNMTPRGEKGLGKKVRNNFGKALSEFLEKDDFPSERRKAEPEQVAADIQAALQKVEGMHSDPDDPKSPTFLELIQSGKLPGNGTPDSEDLEKAIAAREAKKKGA